MTWIEWLIYWVEWVLDQIPLIWARATQIGNDLLTLIVDTANRFISYWDSVVGYVVAQATIIFSHITTVKNAIYAYLVVFWDALIEVISTYVTNATTALTTLIANLGATVVGWIDTVYGYVVSQIGTVVSFVVTTTNNAVTSLQLWVNGLLTPINQLTTYLFNGITILIDRPVFFFTELMRMFFLTFILEEIGHALGAQDANLPPKTDWWNF